MKSKIETALIFLYNMSDIIEEPYFDPDEYLKVINGLEQLKKEIGN